MSKNAVYDADGVHVLSFNVGANTFKSGDPVQIGNFVGVCETASDGGILPGNVYSGLSTQYPTGPGYVPVSGEPVNYASVALKGVWRLPVVSDAAHTTGDWVYILPNNTLTMVAAGAKKFGLLYNDAIAGVVNAPGANVQVLLLGVVLT